MKINESPVCYLLHNASQTEDGNILHFSSLLIFLLIWCSYITMPVQSSTRFPYVALIISLISQHVMIGDICMNIGADQEIGKKLPVSPFMVLYEIGLHLCFRECESYAICLSINFNIKMLMCEMSSQKRNESLSLVNDSDFIYQEIPGVVSIACLP